MSNQSATYTLYLNSNVLRALQEHESAALSLDRRFENLQQTLSTIGLGVGLHKLVEEGKEWIKVTAEYEQSLLRIKNNSADIADGIKNQQFILSEVDKYKIPLQEATDAYGDFLAMVKGSHLASDEVRKLHDEILMIAKIKGISDGQMDAAVRNLGKMLEVGALDARHFFFFEQQLSGIGAYVAKELGVSLNQLAMMRHKGELTGVDPKILLRAIESMATDEAFKLPEALKSTQSELNELSNEWVKFKTDLVLDLKPEIVGFFHSLEDGIHWLKAHKEELIQLGDVLIMAGKAYVGFRVAKLSLDAATTVYNLALGVEITRTSAQTAATTAQTAATQALVLAIRELVIAQEMAAASSATMLAAQEAYLVDATGMAIFSSSQAANIAALTEAQALRTAGMAAGASTSGLALTSAAAVPVFIAAVAAGVTIAAIAYDLPSGKGGYNKFGQEVDGENNFEGSVNFGKKQIVDTTSNYKVVLDPVAALIGDSSKYIRQYEGKTWVDMTDQEKRDAEFDRNNRDSLAHMYPQPTYPASKEEADKERKRAADAKKQAEILKNGFGGIAKPSQVRGNSVTTIHISIGEMNGMKNPQFSVKSSNDMDDIKDKVGTELVKILTGVVNDSQQISD